MARFLRVALAATLFALVSVPASGQTLKLGVHIKVAGAAGIVRVDFGAVGACHFLTGNCTFFVKPGATVRLAAPYPGRFSEGTGPAAACGLSTCSFTMTSDADVTATFTAGDGPTATLTTTRSGDGAGFIVADGLPCAPGVCTVTYLQGSSVQVLADPGASARFSGYSSGTGDAAQCGANATCDFILTGDASVTGTFLALTSFTVRPSSAIGVPGGPAQVFTATGTYTGGVTGTILPGRGAWTSAPGLPVASENLAAAALGGKVYAMGGDTSTFLPALATNQLAAFDPGTQMWTTLAPMIFNRKQLGAATAAGLLYAIGGSDNNTPHASMERYDPVIAGWTLRASMPAPRQGLVAGTVQGIIYAAGGAGSAGQPLATLEAYDPAADAWTPKAPMPTPRKFAVGGVVDGILYVVGGRDAASASVTTVEAYDPATNTWTTRAPLLSPIANAAAVADGLLYVIGGDAFGQAAVQAYDPVADAWTWRAPLRFPRGNVAAASLNGIVYAIGGYDVSSVACCNRVTGAVEAFADSLRWSSSAPAVARIDQAGVATPLSAGTATITAAVGGQTCGTSCPIFSVVGPSDLSLDAPANNSSVARGAMLTIGGWSLNRAASIGTGVDAVHVYVTPDGGSPIFLGAALYGEARPDVGAIYGAQFTNSGFLLRMVVTLATGSYTVTAYAHNALTQQFDVAKSARITVTPAVSNPFINVDTPAPGATVTSAFEVGGWAFDAGAPTGTGVDAVQFYVFPNDGASPGVFIGSGSYGLSRPDVGFFFGSRFTNSGYHFTITGLGPGAYLLGVYARSTVTGSFSIVRTLHFTVNATALMSIDTPGAEATIAHPTFEVAGWSIDRAVESTAQTGTGVDALHVYAYPNPGSGQAAIFLGVATVGIARPDVAAAYGSRYNNSGYTLAVDRAALGLVPGIYSIAVASHSAVSGTFNNIAVVRVTLQ